MRAKDGGPAFPRADTLTPLNGHIWSEGSTGMSLRDWFAGMAMHKILDGDDAIPWLLDAGDASDCHDSRDRIAGRAYQLADAMIAESNRKLEEA